MKTPAHGSSCRGAIPSWLGRRRRICPCSKRSLCNNPSSWKMVMAPSPDKHYRARILERRDLSPDLWTVRIDPGGPFEFRAGQYATLGVEHEGRRIERAYSIVSCRMRTHSSFSWNWFRMEILRPIFLD